MKTKLRLTLCLLLSLGIFALYGCGQKPLPEGMTEDGVKASATEVLDALHARDYETVFSMSTGTMQSGMPPEVWAETFDPIFEDTGPFTEISSMAVGGVEENGVLYATAVAKCSYQNGSKTFTLNFNGEGALAGLFVK